MQTNLNITGGPQTTAKVWSGSMGTSAKRSVIRPTGPGPLFVGMLDDRLHTHLVDPAPFLDLVIKQNLRRIAGAVKNGDVRVFGAMFEAPVDGGAQGDDAQTPGDQEHIGPDHFLHREVGPEGAADADDGPIGEPMQHAGDLADLADAQFEKLPVGAGAAEIEMATSPQPGSSSMTNWPGRKKKRSRSAGSQRRIWNSFSCSVRGIAARIRPLRLLSVWMRSNLRLKSGGRDMKGSRLMSWWGIFEGHFASLWIKSASTACG